MKLFKRAKNRFYQSEVEGVLETNQNQDNSSYFHQSISRKEHELEQLATKLHGKVLSTIAAALPLLSTQIDLSNQEKLKHLLSAALASGTEINNSLHPIALKHFGLESGLEDLVDGFNMSIDRDVRVILRNRLNLSCTAFNRIIYNLVSEFLNIIKQLDVTGDFKLVTFSEENIHRINFQSDVPLISLSNTMTHSLHEFINRAKSISKGAYFNHSPFEISVEFETN